MFTLLYNPYLVNWFTRGEGGVKIDQNLVHVVCERPLIENLKSGKLNPILIQSTVLAVHTPSST